MEKILKIKEETFTIKDHYSDFDGFVIVTDKQDIKVGVSNSQSCCESFGCLISNDDVGEFIGAELLSIERVDEGLNTKMIDAGKCLDEGGAIFVNFNTSKGKFQIVAYNSHNGYYGHTAVIISQQLNTIDSL